MHKGSNLESSFFILVLAVALISVFTIISNAAVSKPATKPEFGTVTPQELAGKIKAGKAPRIVCVGFPFLYQAAHIPGALIKGPAREAAGLKELTRWARSIPKNTPLVIYCGCCPFSECPNVGPAYRALRHAGLTNVKVLLLEKSFASDWVNKGYPTVRVR